MDLLAQKERLLDLFDDQVFNCLFPLSSGNFIFAFRNVSFKCSNSFEYTLSNFLCAVSIFLVIYFTNLIV